MSRIRKKLRALYAPKPTEIPDDESTSGAVVEGRPSATSSSRHAAPPDPPPPNPPSDDPTPARDSAPSRNARASSEGGRDAVSGGTSPIRGRLRRLLPEGRPRGQDPAAGEAASRSGEVPTPRRRGTVQDDEDGAPARASSGHSAAASSPGPAASPGDLAAIAGGRWLTWRDQRVMSVVRRHPLETEHGAFELRWGASLDRAARTGLIESGCAGKRDRSASLRRLEAAGLLLFDIETTGLATSRGAFAFCVAFGAISNGELVVEQLVAPTPRDEPALLRMVADRLTRRSTLVTYNGRSFDVPFMRRRYEATASAARGSERAAVRAHATRLDEPIHLDLYHVAKKHVGGELADLKLATLEAELLEYVRVDDLPGSEAPRRYAAMLAEDDPALLLPVLEHNHWDVVSLLPLVGVLGAKARSKRAAAERVRPAQGGQRATPSSRDPSPAVRTARPAMRDQRADEQPGPEAAERRSATGVVQRGYRLGPRSRSWGELKREYRTARRAGDVETALSVLEEMSEIQKADAYPLYELARYWASEGNDPARALAYLERAAQLAPWDTRVRKLRERLERSI